MDSTEERRAGLRLMEKTDILYFMTIDGEDYPQTRAVFNLRNRGEFASLAGIFEGHDGDMLVYIGTNTSSAKVEHAAANPAVCLYYCQPGEFHGIMLSGRAEIVEDMEIKRAIWQDGWEMYYPGGPEDPDYTVLRVLPRRIKGWHGDHKFEFELNA